MNKVKLAVAVGVVVAAGVVEMQLLQPMLQTLTSTEEQLLIQGFRIGSEQANREAPRMIDDETRLDYTSVGPGARMNYFYTLVEQTAAEVDLDFMHGAVKYQVVEKLCSSADIRNSLQLGATFGFHYRGNDGVEVTQLDFDASACPAS